MHANTDGFGNTRAVRTTNRYAIRRLPPVRHPGRPTPPKGRRPSRSRGCPSPVERDRVEGGEAGYGVQDVAEASENSGRVQPSDKQRACASDRTRVGVSRRFGGEDALQSVLEIDGSHASDMCLRLRRVVAGNNSVAGTMVRLKKIFSRALGDGTASRRPSPIIQQR